MTFEEWWQDDDIECADYDTVREVWNYQQQRIDELEHKLALREAFIAGLQFSKSQSSNHQANGG